MFDFHLHTRVSFDGSGTGQSMALAAKAVGLREICFTDHMDYDPLDPNHKLWFDLADYEKEYDNLDFCFQIIILSKFLLTKIHGSQ